jgi:hypothetical protein
MNSKNVAFPDELLVNRTLETTIFTKENDLFGIAVLSEQGEDGLLVLRIYQLLWSEEEDSFIPVQELEAFGFYSREELVDFVERLPDISGLEMLMLLNPLPDKLV